MITFKEDTHEYFNGDKKLISVTQLMRKHGLAPDYSNVPDAVLRAKAERGTLIHKEIEEYNRLGEIGFTKELSEFISHITLNDVEVCESETIIYNDICAGTVDLVVIDNNGDFVIADIKTTANLHKEAVSWQLSIYAELYKSYKGILEVEKGQVYHFDKDGNLKVVDIPLKPVKEVERLFECERNGEIYKQELVLDDFHLSQLAKVESIIKRCEEEKKRAEETAVKMRADLMDAMERNGVQSFENDRIKLTYVAPTTRTAIDSTRLKKELPEIAEKYSKTSQVKASLRITLKEVE